MVLRPSTRTMRQGRRARAAAKAPARTPRPRRAPTHRRRPRRRRATPDDRRQAHRRHDTTNPRATIRGAITPTACAEPRGAEAIATANGNTRSVGTPGYDLSAEYVRDQLEARVHGDAMDFDVNVFTQNGPASFSGKGRDYDEGADFRSRTTPPRLADGDRTRRRRALGQGNASSSGCQAKTSPDSRRGHRDHPARACFNFQSS